MRKSFTRLFGLFMLFSVMCLYAVAQVPAIVPTLTPVEHAIDVDDGSAAATVFKMELPGPVTINSGAGIISLNKWTAGGPVELAPIQVTSTSVNNPLTGTVQVSGNVVTFSFANYAALTDEQGWYYITVSPDAFKVNGAVWAGILANPTTNPSGDLANTLTTGLAAGSNYMWEFRVEDATAPNAVTLFPVSGSIHAGYLGTGVAPNTNLAMTFTEQIQLKMLNADGQKTTIALYHSNGDLVDMIYVKANLTAGGQFFNYTEPGTGKFYTVTMNPAQTGLTITGLTNLVPLNEYYVRITKGAIVDMYGLANTSICGKNDNTSWVFTAADNQAPTVTSPINLATNVERRPNIVLNFADNFALNNNCSNANFQLQLSTSLYSDPQNVAPSPVSITPINTVNTAGEVTPGRFLVEVENPAAVWTAVACTPTFTSANVIGLRPNAALPHACNVRVTVNADGSMQDGSANVLPQTVINFKTGDFLPPQFVAVNPTGIINRDADNNQKVDITLSLADVIDDPTANTAGPIASLPLNIWAYPVAHHATMANAPTIATIKGAGKQIAPYYAVGGALLGYRLLDTEWTVGGSPLACDTEYDFYFYAEDAAQTRKFGDGTLSADVNAMSEYAVGAISSVKKLDFHTTDNCFNNPVLSFLTAGVPHTNASAVKRNDQIVITFDEEVKLVGAATWSGVNPVVTITVPDNTFFPADADLLPDAIACNAVLDATNKILTISEMAPDRYTTGAVDFAQLLSNVTYTVTLNKTRFSDDANGDILTGGNRVGDDDPRWDYGTDNLLGANQVFTFTTEDYEGPVAFYTPVDQAGIVPASTTIVPINTAPQIRFTEPIYDGAGALITDLTADNHFELVNVATGANVLIDATYNPVTYTVTLTPQVALTSETIYRVKITQLLYDRNGIIVFNYDDNKLNEGAATDIEGIGLCDGNAADDPETALTAMESVFETKDVLPPAVAFETNPVSGMVNVMPNATILITFSENVREIAGQTPISVADDNMIRSLIKLKNPAGAEVEFNVINVTHNLAPENTIVEIDPIDYPFLPTGYLYAPAGATYTVEVTGVEDDAFNNVSASAPFTVNNPAPAPVISVTSTDPANTTPAATISIAQNKFVLNLNRTVDQVGGTITITQISRHGVATGVVFDVPYNVVADVDVISADKKSWTYNFGAALQDDAVYEVVITPGSYQLPDASAVWPAGGVNYTYRFNTEDKTGPVLTIDGINNANVVPLNGLNLNNFWKVDAVNGDKLVFTFTEPLNNINLGAGHIWIKRVDNGFTVAEWDMTNSNISKLNNVLTVNVPANLIEYGLQYFVEMDGTFVTDNAGNPFTWNHTTLGLVNQANGFFGANKLIFQVWNDTAPVYYANMGVLGGLGWSPDIAANDVDPAIGTLAIKFTGAARVNPSATAAYRLVINDQNALTPATSIPVTTAGLFSWSPDFTVAYVNMSVIQSTYGFAGFTDNNRYWIDITPGTFSKKYDNGAVDAIMDTNPATWTDGVTQGKSTIASGWYFSTWDNTAPTVTKVEAISTVTSVVAPATRGTIGTDIRVTFSEPVALVAANWAAVFTVNGSASSLITAGTLSADKKSVVLTMHPDFERDMNARAITLGINVGTIQDLATAPNANAGALNVGGFTIQDLREPIITQFAVASTAAGTQATLNVTVDEASTVFVLAQPNTATVPSAAAIIAANRSYSFAGTVALPLAQTITYTGLTECQNYRFYMVARDAEGNVSDNNAVDADNVAATATSANPALYTNPGVAYVMNDVTDPVQTDKLPTNGSTIERFTQWYGTAPALRTTLKLYFNEEVIWKAGHPVAGDFRVRDINTNVDFGVTAMPAIQTAVVGGVQKWWVELVPNQDWPAAGGSYYVECEYGIISDTDCGGAPGSPTLNNDWPEALYGKTDWYFNVSGVAHNKANTVQILYPEGGVAGGTLVNLDGKQNVIIPAAGSHFILRYNNPVKVNTGGIIYVYKYDDLGANPHEIIAVSASNVTLENGNKDVKISLRHLVSNLEKQHYRIVLPANMVNDFNYSATDPSTLGDLTPLHANTNAANLSAFTLASANDTRADGPFIDFWALDQNNPNAYWTSVWEGTATGVGGNTFNGNRYYGPTGSISTSMRNNFPTRNTGIAPNADNSDYEVGNIANFPDRTIYLNITEFGASAIYYYNNVAGSIVPGAAVLDNADVASYFTMTYGSPVVNVPFTANYELANKRIKFVITAATLPSETTITLAFKGNTDNTKQFADQQNNKLSTVASYVFKTWVDATPTVAMNYTRTSNTAEIAARAAKRPDITFSFNRPMLIADIYQPLQNEDVLNLVTLVGPAVLGGPNVNIPLTVVTNTDHQTYVVRPTQDLVSEGAYTFTVVSDGTLEAVAPFDIDLVDNMRTYTRNGNLFNVPLANRTLNFTVEDLIAPVVKQTVPNINDFHPADNTNPVAPLDPLGAWGAGERLAIEFSENVVLNAANTLPIEIRRAWASGPQSEESGSIFQLVDKAQCSTVGNVLYIDYTGSLESFKGYYVLIPEAFVKDEAGFPYAGITTALYGNTANTVWNFTTDDGTNPYVLKAYPQIFNESIYGQGEKDQAYGTWDDGYRANNVSVNAEWFLQFSENVQIPAGAGYIVVYKRDDTGLSPDGNAVLVINLNNPLDCQLTGSDPQNGKTSDKLIISIPNTAEFAELIKHDVYYLRYNAGIVRDLPTTLNPAGNPIAARNGLNNYTWDFETSEHAVPAIVDLYPNQEATCSDQDVNLTMSFDPAIPVKLGNGNIRIYEWYYNSGIPAWNSRLVHTIAITDATQVSLNAATNTVNINPSISLEDNVTKYYVLVDASAITNTTTGDFFAGISNDFGWYFNTCGDNTAPAFASAVTNVVCGTTPETVTARLTLTDRNGIKKNANYNTPVGTNVFELWESGAEGATPFTKKANINSADVTVTSVINPLTRQYDSPLTVDINLGGYGLLEQRDYYIMVNGSPILDNSRVANAFVGTAIAANSWNFSINDFTRPVVAASPIGTNNNERTVSLVADFDENVQVGTAPVLSLFTQAGVPVQQFTITSANIVNDKVTVDVTGLTDGVTYYATYAEGFVTDMPYGACTSVNPCDAMAANVWQFTIDDNEAPVIAGSNPRVGNAFIVTVTGNEPIVPVAGNITLTATGAPTITLNVATPTSVVGGNKYEYSVPFAQIVDGVEYTVIVPAGAYRDLATVPNTTALTTWQLNTGDNTAPLMTGNTPINNAVLSTYVNQVLTATFNEAVVPGAGAITINGGAAPIATVVTVDPENANRLFITPATNLDFDVNYTVVIAGNAVQDLAGLNFTQVAPWGFTIVDNEFNHDCLTKLAYSPYDGTGLTSGIPVGKDVNLVINFCERVAPGVVKGIKVYEVDGTSLEDLFGEYTVTSANINGNVVTIPVTGLKDYTTYCVLALEAAVYDENGNKWLGISNPTSWNFTTGDNTQPTANLVPAALTNQKNSFNVGIEFSENVVDVAANVTVSEGTVVVTGSGKTYNAAITANDLSSVVLTVGTGIKDESGRNNLASAVTGTYVVGDNTKPTIVTVAGPAAPIATSFTVGLTFDEAVTGVASAITVSNNATLESVTGSGANWVVKVIAAAEKETVNINVGNTIVDGNNNTFAGQVINYTIGDWTRPVVEQHSDQLSDNNTAQDFIVTLTFSADANVTPADIMVIGASNFTVNALGGNVFAANISAEDLSTVTVVASSSIADEAGNLLTGETTASYVVGDNTAPTLVAVPAAGSNNTNAFEVILNFSEAVVIPANAITVTNGTLVGIETISGSKYSVTLSGDDNTTVELHVPGTVTDLAGNNFTGATFAYSIGDNTAPLVIDVTPDTNVPQQMNFIATFTFNEPVFGFAEGITILNAGTPVIAKEGNSYAVMIDAIQEGDVTVQLDENIVDANGNALVPVQYVFTADKTAPVVAASSTQTANNTLNEFDISLVFTEPVVNVLEGVVVTGTTFSETTQVTPSLYTIHVKGNDGASIKVTVPTTVEDLAGNKLANEASFTYSIGDNTAPVIVSVVPESGDKMTNTFNVVITFSEPVINVPANVSVTNGTVAVTGSGAVYTAAITAIDHANVALTIATGIKDASDRNALAAGSTNNYTIGDNTKPTATLSALADPQATVFTVNVNFSEDVVMPAEGGITVTGATKSVVTKVNDSRYSVEITAAEEATVVVNANNTITDAAGNALVPATASYKVGDFTAPTVVADPASGEKMQNSFTVKLTFSDDAIVTANDIMVNGATAVNKTNVGNVYSVALTAADYANVSIMVANTIKDEAKNAITGNLLFNYTVADNTPPVISVDPVSAKDTVAVFDLTLVFSESVTIPAGAISVNSPATIKVEPLSNGKVYKATISGQDNTTVTLTVTDAIVDQAGNKLANGTFTYTIGDHSVPTVKITPAGGATNLNKDFSVDLVFSEAVTGVATGVEVTGGVATVTGSGTTYKVAIASKDMTTVVLKLKNTIADLAGNKIAEVTQVYNTGDFTAPVVTVPASTSVNNITGTVPVTSNEVGVAFIAKSDVAANQAAIVAAIAANKAKQAPVVTASTAVEFSAAGLVAGTYKAYAIDAAGNIGTAVNTFEVTDVPMLAIKAIQGEGAASPYAGKVVATKGVVTALQADKKGYFIQDANEAYGGIFIYDNQLKGNVQLGTAIKVVGTVNEYYELTQIKDLIAVEYIAPMVTPAPIVVNVADVAKEQYEGVLVTVEGVAVNALPDANKEWKIMKPIGTTVLVDDQFYPYTPVIDHHYDVTGVVNYTYNFYKIAPRIASDIVDLTPLDTKDLATSVKVYPNPFDKFIKLEVSSDVTITKAVITNMAGQKIKEVINPDNTIPTSELRSGVYFISLHTEDGIAKTERIIKR